MIGVTDNIVVNRSTSPRSVEAVIEETFKREAKIDARHIRTEVSDDTAKLHGHVHRCRRQTRRERRQRRRAGSPGWSHLVVSP